MLFAASLRLVVEAGKLLPRSAVQSLLWPDIPDADARHRLRQTIYALKRAGIQLVANDANLGLMAEDVRIDYREAIANCQQDFGPLLREFLPGYSPNISHPFDRWLQELRDQVNLQICNALVASIGVRRQNGRWLEVEAAALRCLAIDPLNEEATLGLAEARAMGGNKIGAVRLLERYKKDLAAHASSVGLPSALLRQRISDRFTPAESPLVGRESAIAAITSMVRQMRRSAGGGYLVKGGAGLGKTRLIEEISRTAALEGVSVVHAECLPSEARCPLSVLTKVVSVIQRLPGAIGCSPASLQYLRRLTGESLEMPVAYDGRDAPSFIYAAIKRSILDVIAAVTHEISLLVVIDDIDQADEQSIEIVADLVAASHSRSLLVLMTARDLSGSAARLATLNRGLRSHALEPLTRAESSELLRLLTSSHHGGLSADLETLYIEMAGGSPQLIHELARYWESCGHRHPVPPSIESALHERIGALGESELLVLQTIAMLGQHTTTGRLVRLLELPEAELVSRLDCLEHKGFIRWEHGAAHCMHSTLANLVCARLTSTIAQSAHGKIANALQSELEPPHDSSLLWDCANHYRLAGLHRDAIAMLGRCSDRLLKLGLPHEATAMWRHAVEWCQSDQERVLVQEKIIPALLAEGDLARVSRAAAEVSRLRKTLRIGSSTWSQWQIDVLEARMYALEDVEPLLIEASACLGDESAASSTRVRAGICAMICAFNLHDPVRLKHFHHRLLSLAGEVTVRPVDWLTMSMVYDTYVGDIEKGAQAGEALVTYARLSGSATFLAQSLRRYAMTLRLLGQFDDARAALNEALQLVKWMQSRSYVLATLTQIGETFIEQGDLDSARGLLHKIISPEDRRRFPFRAIDIAQLKAMIALIAGNRKEALRICDARAFRKWRSQTSQSSGRIKHGVLAVSTLLAITRERVHRPTKLISALEHEFGRLQGLGNQDFAAFALCKALSAEGQDARAHAILVDYLRDHRRERYAAPAYLTALFGLEAKPPDLWLAGIKARSTAHDSDAAG
jgi:DNA-binding SARP family transcriptional activator/tetratricopeptide (TPR) repeat protein